MHRIVKCYGLKNDVKVFFWFLFKLVIIEARMGAVLFIFVIFVHFSIICSSDYMRRDEFIRIIGSKVNITGKRFFSGFSSNWLL